MTKIFFSANFDSTFAIQLKLGTKFDTNELKVIGLYKTIKLSKIGKSIDIKNSEIKHPIEGLIQISKDKHDIFYPINESINME